MEKIDYITKYDSRIDIKDVANLMMILENIKDEDVIINKKLLMRLVNQIDDDYWAAIENNERM